MWNVLRLNSVSHSGGRVSIASLICFASFSFSRQRKGFQKNIKLDLFVIIADLLELSKGRQLAISHLIKLYTSLGDCSSAMTSYQSSSLSKLTPPKQFNDIILRIPRGSLWNIDTTRNSFLARRTYRPQCCAKYVIWINLTGQDALPTLCWLIKYSRDGVRQRSDPLLVLHWLTKSPFEVSEIHFFLVAFSHHPTFKYLHLALVRAENL